jgi:DNA-directed RNA polymerase II subunit RPB1
MAILRVTSDNLEDNQHVINSSNMGIIKNERNERCNTCNCNANDCPGHFGYISLFKPVFHITYITECVNILQRICKFCSKLLNQEIKSKKKKCSFCHKEVNNYKKVGLKIYEIISIGNNRREEEIKPEKVYDIFQKISDEDCRYLGFNPRFTRPEWMIIKNLAVCPLAVRPPVSVDSSLTSHDDLTLQYIQIIKNNNDLTRHINNGARAEVINSDFDKLQINVAAFMNNNLSYTKVPKIGSGEPFKSLISRINGKFGGIRGNLMGKRVDFCARTVISPDPNLDVDEIGIPLIIAKDLTFPEEVTSINKHFLQNLVKNGFEYYPGAKQVTNKNGTFNLKYAKKVKLEIGDIVERNVLNGDYIIFNRQPSLHKMSMMGHRVKI